MSRVFSGVQPSAGQVHIGNYLGAMRKFVELSKAHETTVCIVDFHALNSVKDKQDLEQFTLSLAAAYLAIGLDPNKTVIFRQSDVPEVCELTWYLSTNFPLGLLERSHALKDAKAKDSKINAGLMYYPILMAADILLNKAELIPVGADQKQHLEMTREIAIKFNHLYGKKDQEIFPIPEPLIDKDTGVIPGLDGRKMSKSYDNFIGLFETEKKLKKKVMKIVTDSKGVEDKKDAKDCNVFKLYKFFANQTLQDQMTENYKKGGYGYGEAKLELLRAIKEEIDPIRESYNSWITKPDEIRDILASGAKRNREISKQTIVEVREALGLGKIL